MRLNKCLLVLGASCWGAALAFGAPLSSLHAKSRMSRSTPGQKPSAFTTEIWMKGAKMRAQMGDQIQIIDGKNMYIYSLKDPQKRVLVGPVPPQAKASSIAQRMQQMIPAKASKKKVGTARVLQYPTTIYEISMPGEKETLKSWEANVSGTSIPLKVEAHGAAGTMGNEVTSLTVNPTLPDSLFTPPAGYKRVSISAHPPMPPAAVPAHPKH